MPATSKTQQRLMGTAYAVKSGDAKIEDIDAAYRDKVKELVDGMTLQQLKDYASTEHKGLPDKVKEKKVIPIEEYWLGARSGNRWYSMPAQSAELLNAEEKDKQDRLVQRFIEFISGKKKKSPILETDAGAANSVAFHAPAAGTSNTPGMGNVALPSTGDVGSGDRFDNGTEEDDPKRKVGMLSYDEYKKWYKKWLKHQKEDQA